MVLVSHGGESYSESVIIDEDVKKAIRDCFEIAPLHNPANMMGVDAVENVLSGVRQVAGHRFPPNYANQQSLPLWASAQILHRFEQNQEIRLFGTSHKFVAGRVSEHERRMLRSMKIITCHIGNGASVTAINHGKSVSDGLYAFGRGANGHQKW